MMAVFGPPMAEPGRGPIINESNIGAVEVRQRFGVYAAAKAGLKRLDRRIRSAVGPVRPGERDISWDIRQTDGGL
jgi:NADP-dependent 3-hydroxy acid dehydrogenase YdfG